MERFIYVVFSSTPYRIGKLIRRFTGERYNHVSIALDADLHQMYSYARRFYHTPFYGGFVKESRGRYYLNGQPSQIKICRLPVSSQDYEKLAARLNAMYVRREQLLYNHLSVVTIPFKRLVHLKDARICSEFVAEQLQLLGVPVDHRRYYSVGTLEKLLADRLIYVGDALPPEEHDRDFFDRHPVPYFTTLRSLGRLLYRLVK